MFFIYALSQGTKSCCPGHVHPRQPVFCPLFLRPGEVSADPRTLGAQPGRACGGVPQTLQSPRPQHLCTPITETLLILLLKWELFCGSQLKPAYLYHLIFSLPPFKKLPYIWKMTTDINYEEWLICLFKKVICRLCGPSQCINESVVKQWNCD